MNQELAGQMLQLSRTGLEGLEHICELNEKGDYETGVKLFSDEVWAVSEIEKALAVDDSDLDFQLKDAQDELTLVFATVADAYEDKAYQQLTGLMDNSLVPLYKKWQEGLQTALQPYLN